MIGDIELIFPESKEVICPETRLNFNSLEFGLIEILKLLTTTMTTTTMMMTMIMMMTTKITTVYRFDLRQILISYKYSHTTNLKSDPFDYQITRCRTSFPIYEIKIHIHTITSSNGIIFRVTAPLWESTSQRWIPLTKASDVGLWYFLWSASEQTAAQTIETLVIWDAITLVMTSL